MILGLGSRPYLTPTNWRSRHILANWLTHEHCGIATGTPYWDEYELGVQLLFSLNLNDADLIGHMDRFVRIESHCLCVLVAELMLYVQQLKAHVPFA